MSLSLSISRKQVVGLFAFVAVIVLAVVVYLCIIFPDNKPVITVFSATIVLVTAGLYFGWIVYDRIATQSPITIEEEEDLV